MDFALLRTPAGELALAEATRLLGTGTDRLTAVSTLRARFGPDLAAAALTQATLRQRARVKFGAAAATMFFTREGLEQATRGIVALRRARRLEEAGVTALADLGCGIGADLRAVVSLKTITGYGVEADPVTAQCAALNAPQAEVTCGDAVEFDLSRIDGAFCDPARRRGGRRVFDPADYSPPWGWVTSLPHTVPRAVLKLAPGIDPALLPSGHELELVSVDGEVVEAAAWFGPLAGVPRRATVIKHELAHELTGAGTVAAPVGEPRSFLYDPDGAVVRAHLVAEFASTVDGVLADPAIAYVWSSRHVVTPFARCFTVDEVLPFSLKRLRAAVRSRDIGRLEILKRGSALDVEALRRDLRLSGSAGASLILTRVAGAHVAILAHPTPPLPPPR